MLECSGRTEPVTLYMLYICVILCTISSCTYGHNLQFNVSLKCYHSQYLRVEYCLRFPVFSHSMLVCEREVIRVFSSGIFRAKLFL